MKIVRVSGALAEASPLRGASLYELAYVGERRLLGEVIRLDGDRGTIQVYEDTTGLRVGEPVELTGRALTVTLGPGLLGQVLDGVGRPLPRVAASRAAMPAGITSFPMPSPAMTAMRNVVTSAPRKWRA